MTAHRWTVPMRKRRQLTHTNFRRIDVLDLRRAAIELRCNPTPIGAEYEQFRLLLRQFRHKWINLLPGELAGVLDAFGRRDKRYESHDVLVLSEDGINVEYISYELNQKYQAYCNG